MKSLFLPPDLLYGLLDEDEDEESDLEPEPEAFIDVALLVNKTAIMTIIMTTKMQIPMHFNSYVLSESSASELLLESGSILV